MENVSATLQKDATFDSDSTTARLRSVCVSSFNGSCSSCCCCCHLLPSSLLVCLFSTLMTAAREYPPRPHFKYKPPNGHVAAPIIRTSTIVIIMIVVAGGGSEKEGTAQTAGNPQHHDTTNVAEVTAQQLPDNHAGQGERTPPRSRVSRRRDLLVSYRCGCLDDRRRHRRSHQRNTTNWRKYSCCTSTRAARC